MKKILILLVVLVSLMSCNFYPLSIEEIPIYPEIIEYMEENEIDTTNEVLGWVATNINFEISLSSGLIWEKPIKTFLDRKGVCRNFASLSAYMLYYLDKDVKIVVLSKEIIPILFNTGHVFLKVDGYYYDATASVMVTINSDFIEQNNFKITEYDLVDIF